MLQKPISALLIIFIIMSNACFAGDPEQSYDFSSLKLIDLIELYRAKVTHGVYHLSHFKSLSVLADQIASKVTSSSGAGWEKAHEVFQTRYTLLKEASEYSSVCDQSPNPDEEILNALVNSYQQLQDTYQKGENGHRHFEEKKRTALHSLTRNQVRTQSVPSHTILENLKKLQSSPSLYEKDKSWVSDQIHIAGNRCCIEDEIREIKKKYKTKGATSLEDIKRSYELQLNAYQRLFKTYEHSQERNPSYKKRIDTLQEKIKTLTLKVCFENQARTPNQPRSLLLLLANTIAQRCPKSVIRRGDATYFNTNFFLGELSRKKYNTDFTNPKQVEQLLKTIEYNKPVFTDHITFCQGVLLGSLNRIEHDIKKEKEYTESWLHRFNKADVWNPHTIHKLLLSLHSMINQEKINDPTEKSLSLYGSLIEYAKKQIQHFENVIPTLNSAPLSENDHKKYDKLTKKMEELSNMPNLPEPTQRTTTAKLISLLKIQQADLKLKSAKLIEQEKREQEAQLTALRCEEAIEEKEETQLTAFECEETIEKKEDDKKSILIINEYKGGSVRTEYTEVEVTTPLPKDSCPLAASQWGTFL